MMLHWKTFLSTPRHSGLDPESTWQATPKTMKQGSLMAGVGRPDSGSSRERPGSGGMPSWLKKISVLLLTTALLGTSGCSIKPWVKPYERDNLADPLMKLNRHGYAGGYMGHVYQAREAARGAEGGAGGGCGCN